MTFPDIDSDELEEKMMRVVMEVCGCGDIRADTPMNEARARAEQAGMMMGRVLAAALHSGPVGPEIVEEIQVSESYCRERFLASFHRLLAPGGLLREHLNERDL